MLFWTVPSPGTGSGAIAAQKWLACLGWLRTTVRCAAGKKTWMFECTTAQAAMACTCLQTPRVSSFWAKASGKPRSTAQSTVASGALDIDAQTQQKRLPNSPSRARSQTGLPTLPITDKTALTLLQASSRYPARAGTNLAGLSTTKLVRQCRYRSGPLSILLFRFTAGHPQLPLWPVVRYQFSMSIWPWY